MNRNQAQYRAAFRHVRAPADAAERALIRMNAQAPAPVRRLPVRALAAAAVIAALLLGSAGAEAADGGVSNLLAPLYGGARTEIVDGIGVPVDASVTVNGYTLTADAVIGDRYHMSIVYTLTRDSGEPVPAGAHFLEHDNSAARGTGGGSVSWERDGEDPSKLHIVESWAGAAPLWKYADITFRDLVIDGEEDYAYDMAAEGEWKLGFPLRYRDTTAAVLAEPLAVTGSEGYEYEIQSIELSPIGIHMDLLAPNTLSGDPGSRLLPDFSFSLRLADGSTAGIDSSGVSGGGSKDAGMVRADYEASFAVPVPLAGAEALVICGTEIPLDALS